MKKVIFFFLGIFILCQLRTNAEILSHKVYAISHKNIVHEQLEKNSSLQFQTLDKYQISDINFIEKNAILTVKVKEHIHPKRGKRDGYLKINIISYTIPSLNNKIIDAFDTEIYGTLKLTTKKDLKEIAKSAGVSVVGHVLKIPGFSQAVAVSKGLIKPNPDQNRLQSAGTNLYQSTPLTYKDKGKDICIEEDSIVVIKVKSKETEENEDWEYLD